MHRILALAATLLLLGLVALLGATQPTAASVPTLRLVAADDNVSAPGPVSVEVHALEAANLGAWEFTLIYDPSFLTLIDVQSAPGLGNDQTGCNPDAERCVVVLGPRPTLGGVSVGAITYGRLPGLSGDGVIAVLHLQPTGQRGTTALEIVDPLVTDVQGQAITPLVQTTNLTLNTAWRRIFLPAVTNR